MFVFGGYSKTLPTNGNMFNVGHINRETQRSILPQLLLPHKRTLGNQLQPAFSKPTTSQHRINYSYPTSYSTKINIPTVLQPEPESVADTGGVNDFVYIMIIIAFGSGMCVCGVVCAFFHWRWRYKQRQKVVRDNVNIEFERNIIEKKRVEVINQENPKQITSNYIEESQSGDKMSMDNNQQNTTKFMNDDVSGNHNNDIDDNVVEGRVDNEYSNVIDMKTATTEGEKKHIGDV